MITTRLQLVIWVAVSVYFLVIFYLLSRKRLDLKYTLLWLLSGCIMLLLAICPTMLKHCSGLLGIDAPENTLFIVAFFCVIMLLMSFTSVISKMNERIKSLSQTIALLEKQVREREKQTK